jgi:2-methylcitrate dehydratase PrpD
MTSLMRTLAAKSLERELGIPSDVAYEVKRLILDTLGCMLGGWATEKGRLAVRFAEDLSGAPQATLVGAGLQTAVDRAAFANAELANALDADAVFLNVAHHAPSVLAGILAVAEYVNASGGAALEAVLIGYEIAARLTMAMVPLLEAHDGVRPRYAIGPAFGYGYGALGVAVGAGRLLGLDVDRMTHAVGLAAYLCPGPSLLRWLRARPFSMIKYSPMGWTAQAGVSAALLAARGYTGDVGVLDDPSGLPALWNTHRFEPKYLLKDLGQTWECIRWLSYKPEPVCNLYRPHLWLLSKLRMAEHLPVSRIDEIVLRFYGPAGLDRPSDGGLPTTQEAVHMSGIFATALALKGVVPGPKWVDLALTQDPEIQRLLRKIRVEGNPLPTQITYRPWTGASVAEVLKNAPCAIEVSTQGRNFVAHTDITYGDMWGPPEGRFTDDDLVAKFGEMAGTCLPADTRARFVGLVLDEFERLESLAPLMSRLRSVQKM